MVELGLRVVLNTDMATAQTIVADALKTQGFGILTEIDVQSTLKNKLDVDFRPYKILGACNPQLAHQALSKNSEIGLLLPCNVTLSGLDNGQVEVMVVEPLTMLGVVADDSVIDVAEEASRRLHEVVTILAGHDAAV